MQEVQRATAIPRADEESRSGTDATHTVAVETASSRVTLPKHIAPACRRPYPVYRRYRRRSLGLGWNFLRGRQAVMNRTGPAFSRRANSWMERENGVSGWLRIGNGSNSPATHISAAGGTTPSTPQPSRLPNSDGERNSMKGDRKSTRLNS